MCLPLAGLCLLIVQQVVLFVRGLVQSLSTQNADLLIQVCWILCVDFVLCAYCPLSSISAAHYHTTLPNKTLPRTWLMPVQAMETMVEFSQGCQENQQAALDCHITDSINILLRTDDSALSAEKVSLTRTPTQTNVFNFVVLYF